MYEHSDTNHFIVDTVSVTVKMDFIFAQSFRERSHINISLYERET